MGLWKKGVTAITALRKQGASGDEDKKSNKDPPTDTGKLDERKPS